VLWQLYLDFNPNGDDGIDRSDDSRFIRVLQPRVQWNSTAMRSVCLTAAGKPATSTRAWDSERMAQILQQVPEQHEPDLIYPAESKRPAGLAGLQTYPVLIPKAQTFR